MMGVFAVGWQEMASELTRRTSKPVRNAPRRARGARRVPQETVRAIRAEAEAMANEPMTKAAKYQKIAMKYEVSSDFVSAVVDGGMRDDERERLR